MSVFTHHVVVTQDDVEDPDRDAVVLDFYPRSLATMITATSGGLSTEQLSSYVRKAAGRINAILDSHNIGPTSLDVDARELVQAGIIAYAIAYGLRRVGQFENARDYAEEWRDVLETLRDRYTDLGDAVKQSDTLSSNIDRRDPHRSRWKGSTYTGS